MRDVVGATKNTRLQIAQQVEPISQETTCVAGKRVYADSFSENIAREVFTGVNTAIIGLQIAQSPATKPQNSNSAPSEAEAKIKALLDKAHS